MATTLTVTDNANGTGATATISGSSGDSNTVYVTQVTGQIGEATWASGGTLVGDGTVTLTLANGFYFSYCLTAPATISDLVYFGVTNGLDAVAVRIRAAVKTTLQLLNLPCTQTVHIIWDESDKANMRGPCSYISTARLAENEEPYTNALDGIGRNHRIVILDRGVHKMNATELPTYELWRQAFMRAFRNQRVNVTECRWASIEPAAVMAEDEVKGMVVVSAFILKVHTREPRGLGA